MVSYCEVSRIERAAFEALTTDNPSENSHRRGLHHDLIHRRQPPGSAHVLEEPRPVLLGHIVRDERVRRGRARTHGGLDRGSAGF